MKKLFQRLHDWYQNVLPEGWRGKTGLVGLFILWIVIFIFEGYYLISGETDLYLLLGMPGFFLVITFVIVVWGLELFKKEKIVANYIVDTIKERENIFYPFLDMTCYVKETEQKYKYTVTGWIELKK